MTYVLFLLSIKLTGFFQNLFASNHLNILFVKKSDISHFYEMSYYTYITTNTTKNVFYTGMTNNLVTRMKQHRLNKGKWEHFAGRYYCHKLVYYEIYDLVIDAINREKFIKDMSREKKIQLIKTKNPNLDFYCIW
jgi:putative endonuclease